MIKSNVFRSIPLLSFIVLIGYISLTKDIKFSLQLDNKVLEHDTLHVVGENLFEKDYLGEFVLSMQEERGVNYFNNSSASLYEGEMFQSDELTISGHFKDSHIISDLGTDNHPIAEVTALTNENLDSKDILNTLARKYKDTNDEFVLGYRDPNKGKKPYNISCILSTKALLRQGFSERTVARGIKRVNWYINKWKIAAKREQEIHGIPVAITLAQGLLESDAGESSLSVKANNHFGLKCKSKCRGCTCINYFDDSIYDMFRLFDHPKESFAVHSEYLLFPRYKRLHTYELGDYKSWAHGLTDCGYATDKKYGSTLIKIIETLKLNEIN